jgi:hypothetical protein
MLRSGVCLFLLQTGHGVTPTRKNNNRNGQNNFQWGTALVRRVNGISLFFRIHSEVLSFLVDGRGACCWMARCVGVGSSHDWTQKPWRQRLPDWTTDHSKPTLPPDPNKFSEQVVLMTFRRRVRLSATQRTDMWSGWKAGQVIA